MTPIERDNHGPRSVTRLLGLFEKLSHADDGLSLAELSVALGSPKSSLLNMLKPLVTEGYLVHASGAYSLGPSTFRLCAGVLSSWKFPRLIRPYMEELCASTGESVVLGVLNREAAVVSYVEVIDSPHPIRYQMPVGTILPLHTAASGRLLLAHAGAAWRRQYVATLNFKALGFALTRPQFNQELDAIHTAGVCISIDGYRRGVSAIAAPVFDAQGQCVASLSLNGPTERFRDRIEHLQGVVRAIAEKASGLIGAGTTRQARPEI
ncbi:MAG: IclR family transcriptional regulator [Burkholderiaceae bacterium]|nr:IclR family transcriptional regulator [Burkholderiaceae bacterium]MDO9089844.1 IclR family transcriptional regulator [Burkholderiaceae bacterium]MDP1968073.1 IclR family transcriptional regulator [Burkholderiaceae bacterium]